MKKSTYFDSDDFKGWPDPQQLRPYFFAPPGEEWFHTGGNDGALIEAERFAAQYGQSRSPVLEVGNSKARRSVVL